MASRLRRPTALFVILSATPHGVLSNEFDPYQLNGGLVAAVAGKDFVVIASDTRLTDGGYGINSRKYLSGRLWSASSSSPQPTNTFQPSSHDDFDLGLTPLTLGWKRSPTRWGPDGSLQQTISDLSHFSSRLVCDEEFVGDGRKESVPFGFPVMVGSAGCAADCEALKRQMRLEVSALECSLRSGPMHVQSIANLLQQVLYSRRSFPFYSFCVVAGIGRDAHGDALSGYAYVYDAIGSYERVAVASSGTGRELMQPVLDRLFSEPCDGSDNSCEQVRDGVSLVEGVGRDPMAISAGEQRVGAAGGLRPPVQTTVSCSWQTAVKHVATAFQSVAEREISVGDDVVVCVMRSNGSTQTYSIPLKRH
ncbi:hypothetical protein THAOC_16986 [Thalassiosira oceanica]|uniref:Proteasome subunit beta n=1 Tax=Thalassiosira oceanica TaxID=159749 RepID=K0SN76_THAOC|nr:hypothetical protein THAOC_16986 [Thalassiosira oceanica]|mmetsp:Transcript_26635/g.60146  ORF Transcript_26635/g.60146 Transcript_26635/m.60146 type:complete len:364 (+) Transcript_26635:49-1140(+)|eukprot:EJK62406.1 hypothetical protein THAOC_16986 [Thalassiosira oceanica]